MKTSGNRLRNSAFHGAGYSVSMQGRAAQPENWDITAPTGCVFTHIGTGRITVADGERPYWDVRLHGTATAAGIFYITGERDQGAIRVTASQTWANAVWLARVGTATNIGLTDLLVQAYSDAGAWQNGNIQSATLTETPVKLSAIFTSNAGAQHLRWLIQVNVPAAGAVDMTLRIIAPQADVAASVQTFTETTSNDGTWNSRFLWGPNTSLNGNSPNGAEAQYFVDFGAHGTRLSNGANPFDVATEAGILRITGAAVPGGQNASYANNKAYTSGAITTRGKFHRTYGYFEMAARFPPGVGMWPAFWLLPVVVNADESQVSAAELDVVEWYGNNTTSVQGTYHTGSPSSPTKLTQEKIVGSTETTSAEHTYGLHWTADTLTWYYDRVAYGNSVATPSDCKQDMYLAVNLAMGAWAGVVDNASLPGIMRVNSVKVWDAKPF